MALSDYHIFSISCSVKEADIGIKFSELENELGGGFYSQVLYGSENGERSWRLTLPSLTDTGMDSRTVTGINGETLSYASYLWDLYCTQKADGTPFAYRCPRTGNYYLVRFANPELTFSRMLTKLYSTGIELKQWRIEGETVFTPAALEQVWGAWDPVSADGPFGNWWTPEPNPATDSSNGAGAFEFISGDVIATTSGSLPIVRFNSTSDDGNLYSTNNLTIKEVYLLMKIREATFGGNDGILTGSPSPNNAFLNGNAGTANFFNHGFPGIHTHELDGVSYPQNDAAAPMNVWGIVHVRNTVGVAITGLQIGADREIAARHAELDLAYLIISEDLIPKSTQREIMEFLSILKAQLA